MDLLLFFLCAVIVCTLISAAAVFCVGAGAAGLNTRIDAAAVISNQYYPWHMGTGSTQLVWSNGADKASAALAVWRGSTECW